MSIKEILKVWSEKIDLKQRDVYFGKMNFDNKKMTHSLRKERNQMNEQKVGDKIQEKKRIKKKKKELLMYRKENRKKWQAEGIQKKNLKWEEKFVIRKWRENRR